MAKMGRPKKKSSEKYVKINISLPPELYEQVSDMDGTVSGIIQDALIKMIQEKQEQK